MSAHPCLRAGLDGFGRAQTADTPDRYEFLLTAPVVGAAGNVLAPVPMQQRAAILDFRWPTVRLRVQFAARCHAQDGID
jgi:hypothetical protein